LHVDVRHIAASCLLDLTVVTVLLTPDMSPLYNAAKNYVVSKVCTVTDYCITTYAAWFSAKFDNVFDILDIYIDKEIERIRTWYKKQIDKPLIEISWQKCN